MERVEVAPCKDAAAARRFYERMGGMIAAAYLLKAVDCHRDNVIASGEDPVLVDADALWHVSSTTNAQTPLDLLHRTGFFPNTSPRSLQSRSSVLSRNEMRQYKREVINGFSKAWDCILGTKDRRRASARRVQRIQSQKRRWIYRATEKYAAINRASIQAAALRSAMERHLLITRLCQRSAESPEVIEAEIAALTRLDIPYFLRSTNERSAFDRGKVPPDVREALRAVLASLDRL